MDLENFQPVKICKSEFFCHVAKLYLNIYPMKSQDLADIFNDSFPVFEYWRECDGIILSLIGIHII